MTFKKSPTHKLKILVDTIKKMLTEIEEFYAEHKQSSEKRITCNDLGGDDLISILVFIVAKSNLQGLFSQCELMMDFLTENYTNPVEGYY